MIEVMEEIDLTKKGKEYLKRVKEYLEEEIEVEE